MLVVDVTNGAPSRYRKGILAKSHKYIGDTCGRGKYAFYMDMKETLGTSLVTSGAKNPSGDLRGLNLSLFKSSEQSF